MIQTDIYKHLIFFVELFSTQSKLTFYQIWLNFQPKIEMCTVFHQKFLKIIGKILINRYFRLPSFQHPALHSNKQKLIEAKTMDPIEFRYQSKFIKRSERFGSTICKYVNKPCQHSRTRKVLDKPVELIDLVYNFVGKKSIWNCQQDRRHDTVHRCLLCLRTSVECGVND